VGHSEVRSSVIHVAGRCGRDRFGCAVTHQALEAAGDEYWVFGLERCSLHCGSGHIRVGSFFIGLGVAGVLIAYAFLGSPLGLGSSILRESN
jgi:hypothetical protein